MWRFLREWARGGLDRRLAWSELMAKGTMYSLSMGVRHLRNGEPSYFWLNSCYDEHDPKAIGYPVMPIGPNRPFERDEELEEAWAWVLDTTVRRGLHRPFLDEQLWCTGGVESLGAALEDAERTLPGALLSLGGYYWEDDRGQGSGFDVVATFSGRKAVDREARALLIKGPDDAATVAAATVWAKGVAAARGIELRWHPR